MPVLLKALLQYNSEHNIPFSMPGNKSGKAFLRDEIGREFYDRINSLDITEVDPLDNLHKPEGVIREAEEKLARLYNCRKAYFCVNGSTGANMAAIFSAFNEGDEIIVERNCHKSVYNAIVMKKLKVTYIEPVFYEDIFLPPRREEIYKAYKKSKNPKGIILTSPNYYGISYDIKDIILDLKSRGLKVIVDQAHGAHYGVCSALPESLASVSDYTIVSAHKTLPALTGGSYLLVNDYNKYIEYYYSAFMTTSPSYLIMASLDYSRYYLEQYGKEDYERLINLAEEYKCKMNSIPGIKIISSEDLQEGYIVDKSRYIVKLDRGHSGHKLLDYYRSKNIQCEMAFSSGVVIILSPCQGEEELKKLLEVTKNIDMDSLRVNRLVKESHYIECDKIYDPYEVFQMENEEVSLEDSEGRIVSQDIIPYPPGIPIICAGEVMNNEVIYSIREYVDNYHAVIGVNNNRISVLKNTTLL